MARIRTIKPGFFSDEDLSELSLEAHFLAAGLLCQADDEGYFNANPALIKAAVFPLRTPSVNIPGILAELSRKKYLSLHDGIDGKKYGHIRTFLDHQRISHASESKIRTLISAPHTLREDSAHAPHTLREDSAHAPHTLRPEGKGKEVERKGKEGKAPNPDSQTPPFDADHFQCARWFWEEMGQVQDAATFGITADSLRLHARQSNLPVATVTIETLARARLDQDQGVTINRFWFSDGKHKAENGGKGKGNGRATQSAGQSRSESTYSEGELAFQREIAKARSDSGGGN